MAGAGKSGGEAAGRSLKSLILSLPILRPIPPSSSQSSSSRLTTALTKLLPNSVSKIGVGTNVMEYLTCIDLNAINENVNVDSSLVDSSSSAYDSNKSISSSLFKTIITEAMLGRSGGVDVGDVYGKLLVNFPCDVNMWCKWCFRAMEVITEDCQNGKISNDSTNALKAGIIRAMEDVKSFDLYGVVGSLIYCHLKYGYLPTANKWNKNSVDTNAVDMTTTKKMKDKLIAIDEYLYQCVKELGHTREVCRWFKGIPGDETISNTVVGGGELYRWWLSNLNDMYMKNMIDVDTMRLKFREMLDSGHSYVSKGREEYEAFEMEYGGSEWKEKCVEQIQHTMDKSMKIWNARGLTRYNWEELSIEPTQYDVMYDDSVVVNNVKLFRNILSYEMSNPEQISDSNVLNERIRETYRDAARCMYRCAEIWDEWGKWECSNKAENEGEDDNDDDEDDDNGGKYSNVGYKYKTRDEVYETAISAMPNSGLLVVSWAEELENEGNWAKGMEVYKDFNSRCPCSLGYVMLERLIVRNFKGDDRVRQSRSVFKHARRMLKDKSYFNAEGRDKDRSQNSDGGLVITKNVVKKEVGADTNGNRDNGDSKQQQQSVKYGNMTYHVYLHHATVEYKVFDNPTVACKVLELGLEKHADFLCCYNYVSFYLQVLEDTKDVENFTSVVNRSIDALSELSGDDLAGDSERKVIINKLWDRVVLFESNLSRTNDQNDMLDRITDVEIRRMKFDKDNGDGYNFGVSKSVMDLVVKNYGIKAELGMNSLVRLMNRVELIVGGRNSGGISDNRFEKRVGGLHKDFQYDGYDKGNVKSSARADITKAARQKIEDARSAKSTNSADKSKHPDWLAMLMESLGHNRRNRSPPSHITELALQSLLHNNLPSKPADKGPKYFENENAKEDAGGESRAEGKKRGRDEDESDGEDEKVEDNIFRNRQRRKIRDL